MAWLRRLLLLLLFPAAAFGQGMRYDNFVLKPLNTGGVIPVSGALITVCTSAGTGTPCTPKVANIYSDEALTTPIVGTGGAGTTNSDANGNFGFYAAPGSYVVTVTGSGFTSYTIKLVLPIGNATAATFTGTINCTIINTLRCISPSNPQGWAGSDIGAWINSAIAGMPTISGYPAGKIQIGQGVYTQSTLVTISSPYVSIEGAGFGAVQITCTLNSDCWRINTNPFSTLQAGTISGLTLIGQGANNNSVGFHVGDIIGLVLQDIRITQFNGTSAIGLWFDNVTQFTERSELRNVWIDNSTKLWRFTNSNTSANSASFGYTRALDVKMNVLAGQTGISFESGILYGGELHINANATATSTIIALSGLQYTAGPGSALFRNLYDVVAECTGCAGGTFLNVASGSCIDGTGILDGSAGSMTNTVAGTGCAAVAPVILHSGQASPGVAIDFSTQLNFGINTLYLGGLPGVSNVLQLGHGSGTVAGISGALYGAANSGVAFLQTVDNSGNMGLAGGLRTVSSIAPSVAGAANLGTTALPYGNACLGTAATNNVCTSVAAMAGARTWVIPDWGAFGLATQQQPATVILHTAYTNATTTFSTLGDGTRTISFPVAASVDYLLTCDITFNPSATTAVPKIQVTGPASPTAVNITVMGGSSATTFDDATAAAFSTPITTLTAAATTNQVLRITAGIANGVNAGTVALQLAANGAGTLTVNAGSACRIQ